MTLTRFIQVLRARWRLALMVMATSLVFAAALTALVPREYKSTAALLIDMRSSDPLASAAAAALGNGALSTATWRLRWTCFRANAWRCAR